MKVDASSSMDKIQATPNKSNLNESELTVFSYVDRLDCGVQKSWKGNEFTESCHSLKRMGVNVTGYYLLSNKSISFCDMSKNFSDPDFQKRIGSISFEESM